MDVTISEFIYSPFLEIHFDTSTISVFFLPFISWTYCEVLHKENFLSLLIALDPIKVKFLKVELLIKYLLDVESGDWVDSKNNCTIFEWYSVCLSVTSIPVDLINPLCIASERRRSLRAFPNNLFKLCLLFFVLPIPTIRKSFFSSESFLSLM